MAQDRIDQTIAALHDAGASDDEITDLLREKFGAGAQRAAAPGAPLGMIAGAGAGPFAKGAQFVADTAGRVLSSKLGSRLAGAAAGALGGDVVGGYKAIGGLIGVRELPAEIQAGGRLLRAAASNPAVTQAVGGISKVGTEILGPVGAAIDAARAAKQMYDFFSTHTPLSFQARQARIAADRQAQRQERLQRTLQPAQNADQLRRAAILRALNQQPEEP